ncbi:MAG: glycoside hydrolase family 25 protein [Bacteroidetes bacterium]|nr:glycoside hydrolase family 25 protein [Bacteroidota bacterium]
MVNKKNALIKRILFGILSGAFLIFIIYQILQPEKIDAPVQFFYYPEFGIEIPAGYKIHGIDVSRHQEDINWKQVTALKQDSISIHFVFIKATEGIYSVDKNFKKNWQNANDAGLVCGAYHYFLASKSGKDQAKNFLKNVSLQRGNLPPVIDIEELYGVRPEVMRQRMQDWLDRVENTFQVKPIIYTSVNFYNQYLKGYFKDYVLWVSHYYEKERPRISVPWAFWQYNDRGQLKGIQEKVDFNVFNGDTSSFQKILIK